MQTAGRVLAHLLFWGWNLLFLCVFGLGFGPVVMIEMVAATFYDLVPLEFAITGCLLMLAPMAALGIGLWKLRSRPGALLSLLYGVQAPLMLVALMRLFAFRQLTPSITVLATCIILGATGLLVILLAGPARKTSAGALAQVLSQSAYGAFALWIAATMSLVVVPFGALFVWHLPELIGNILSDLRHTAPILFLYVPFAMVSTAAWLVFPVACVGIGLRAAVLAHRHAQPLLGRPLAGAAVVVGVLVPSTALVAGTLQPQHTAFALLEGDPDEALAQRDRIADGLLNAHLWDARYLAGPDLSEEVGDLWREALPDVLAPAAEAAAHVLYAPVIYRPATDSSPRQERELARERYREFFDVPMERAEQDALVDAARDTWRWQDAAAGVLDAGQERVWLDSQEITVEEHGAHATLTIHDEYRNATWDQQEVVVYFSLPETAAITGLWLGHSADRGEAFTHVVAPRGAAQQVFEEQVRQRRDPALIEQIGPRQYRLRAFPVEPREGEMDAPADITTHGPSFHLWLELEVLATSDGQGGWHWPLPQVAEQRNLFSDEQTERSHAVADEARWLPDHLPRSSSGAPEPLAVDLDGWSVQISPAEPSARSLGPVVAIVDTSLSMEPLREELSHALDALEPTAIWCAGPEEVQPCDALDPATQRFFGRVSLGEALRRSSELAELDATVVVLTDRGTHDQATDEGGPPWASTDRRADLWLLHLDGLPQGYSDGVLDLISAGGGVATKVEELQAAVTSGARAGWTVHADQHAETEASDIEPGPRTALAAHAAIEAQAGWSDPAQLSDLDALHDLAVRYDVVSPYSSMIVLVSQRQRDRLAELEDGADRFDRELDDPTDGSADAAFTSSAVPEPHEWVLMGLVCLGLAASRRRRQTQVRGLARGVSTSTP